MKALCGKCCNWMNEERKELFLSLGLLVLRVSFGSMMLFSHGLGKLMSFSEKHSMFPDPLGAGSSLSMTLAIGAEVFCSAALILGIATRLAAVPLIITMLVAVLIVHADDPFAKKEFALLYLAPFITLMLTGPGKFSIDELCAKKCNGT